jgi:NAD(P)-dependent dehydrogenase (short-subunit alcohol dehydrogenase family)
MELNHANPGHRGRVALITGAGKGLGRAYALDLARRGMKIVVNNRRRDGQPSTADAVVEEIRGACGEAIANYDSVETEAGAAAMVAQAYDTYGQLDALICNAGISQGATLMKTPLDEFRQIMDVNFYGTLYPVYAAWPRMREAGFGRIVLTTSGAGFFGVHGLTAYSASKGAVIAFGRALALEGESRNVRTNIVGPYAHTPMTAKYMNDDHARRFPPTAVAPLIAWWVSPDCQVNGEAVMAAGGVFRRAEAMEGPGLLLPDATPEAIAEAWGRIGTLDGAVRRPDSNASFAAINKMVP